MAHRGHSTQQWYGTLHAASSVQGVKMSRKKYIYSAKKKFFAKKKTGTFYQLKL
jgi:hypothetical protein